MQQSTGAAEPSRLFRRGSRRRFVPLNSPKARKIQIILTHALHTSAELRRLWRLAINSGSDLRLI